MREILFRGKRVDNGEWVYGVPIKDQQGEMVILESIFECEEYDCRGANCWYVDEKTVGQYTGKKDTNNNRIFERDIIKYTRTKWHEPLHTDNGKDLISLHEVYFDEKQAAFKDNHYTVEDKKLIGSGLLAFDDPRAEENIIEIIGNIYDNPELLKDGE